MLNFRHRTATVLCLFSFANGCAPRKNNFCRQSHFLRVVEDADPYRGWFTMHRLGSSSEFRSPTFRKCLQRIKKELKLYA